MVSSIQSVIEPCEPVTVPGSSYQNGMQPFLMLLIMPAVPAMSCQNVCCEIGLLHSTVTYN